MAKSRKQRKSRKSASRKYKKLRGGAYSFTGAAIGTPGTISNYGQEWVTTGKPLTPDCVAANKSDIMGYSGPAGLPGLSGGRRRRQSGGRYGFDLSYQVTPSGGPANGGIPNVQRIACEGSTPNPLNPGPHTPSTEPPVQGGGALGGIGSPNLAYYAPTAGYGNTASSWVSSVGAPVQIQVPYEARAWNPACLKTGGGNNNNNDNNNNDNMDGGRRKRKGKKGSRKTRKGRKGSRKH